MLAMGRALMSRPKVLLLDEPSMGLSPIMVDKIFEVVRDVYAQGVTVLLVEQNASRALVHIAHHLKDLVDHDGRQAHGRLVEQQDFGAAHQGAAHGQHLLLTAGHGARQLVLAFAQTPKVLLLDEPSMGLSPIMVDKIFEVVRDVYAQGVTVLLVEQNASRALAIADRGYVMDSGLITMTGVGKDMLEDPKVRAAYLGE